MKPPWKNHWNIQYLRDRMLRSCFEFSHSDSPWLTKRSIEIIGQHLTPDSTGFEWGSGRSTIWFAPRVKTIHSVEHDQDWFENVSNELDSKGLHNVTLNMIPLNSRQGRDYVHAFDSLLQPPDFILVDGKLRDCCALRSLILLKPGGMLIVDNINRFLPSDSRSPESVPKLDKPSSYKWSKFEQITSNWSKVWTCDGVTDTALFFKPLISEGNSLE